MKYYLAHPFDSRKAMRQWELETEVQYDIEIINPFYDIGRCDVEPIDDGTKARYEGLNSTELVNRDGYKDTFKNHTNRIIWKGCILVHTPKTNLPMPVFFNVLFNAIISAKFLS